MAMLRTLIGSLPVTLSVVLTVLFGCPTAGIAELAPGESATLLPDGRWLIIGGQGSTGPVASVSVWDPTTGVVTTLPRALVQPRAWHTATLFPDGTVLVLGGWGSGGAVETTVERVDPASWTIEILSAPGLTPRAAHTATLLTDGRVLVAGGVGADGTLIAQAELWDPDVETMEQVPLIYPRSGHRAHLLADGSVWLAGGYDAVHRLVVDGEQYDPETDQFRARAAPPPDADPSRPAHVAGSIPRDGAIDVAPETRLVLRFSLPVRVETVDDRTVWLSGPRGLESAHVLPAEAGHLVFVTPETDLAPGAAYSLMVNGVIDGAGRPVPLTEVRFRTAEGAAITGPPAGAPTAPLGETPGQGPAAREEAIDWSPDPTRLVHWRTDRPESPWQRLPALEADAGVTALSGQVLRLQGQPLDNVMLQIGEQTTRTDATGRFLLTGVLPGRQVLLIDGRSASRPGQTYGVFQAQVELNSGQTTVLPYTIWMPRIDTEHAVTIPSPTTAEVVITTPRIPGFELHIPAGVVIHDHTHHPVNQISITPIPVDRPPFPLPAGVEVPVYFTIQPGGGHVGDWRQGGMPAAWIVYPNYRRDPFGARLDFWNYDPDEKGWHIYGNGAVTPDERQVVPNPGTVLYEFTGAMYGGTGFGPNKGPQAGGGPKGGDPIDVGTGLLVVEKTDLVLPDVIPIVLRRTYRPADARSRAFGRGATHPYEIFLAGDASTYSWVDVVREDGGRLHYVRISPGTAPETAVFEHTTTPTRFYKSRIAWNGTAWAWDLTLKDGTVYTFREGFGATRPGQSGLLRIRDRFGNSLTATRDGLGTLTRLVTPNGRWLAFTYDASTRITQIQDNLGRTVSYTYDADGRLWKVTDPAGGVTEYTYDATHRMLTAKDPRGIVFLTQEYDASDRVTRQTQADGTTYQFVYTVDGNGKITQTDMTDPRGIVRRVTFNTDGYASVDTAALGRPEEQTTTYERQVASNFVTAELDALGRRTAYTYDMQGNRVTVTRLAGSPDAVTTSYTYEPTFNQVASITDPLNHTTAFTYDAQGRLTTVTDPLSQQTTLTSNAAGQPLTISDPLANTTSFTYEAGDLVTVADPLGNITRRFFDGAGRLLALTDPLGRTTRYEYDALNRLTRVTDSQGGTTQFAYDPNGNLLSVTDARNNVTSYTYNTMDRLATRTDPLLHQESYQYDGNGNLSQVTDRKGQVTTFAYDGRNRRTQATYADAAATSYGYDAGNRLTSVGDSIAGTINRAYDGLDRLTQEATPQGTVSYTYDAAGRRTGMTVAGQPAIAYGYDSADRLTQIHQGSASVGFAYDAASRRTSLTLPNGIVIESSYDTASRLTGLTYTLGQTTLGALAYTYDAAGNRSLVGGSWAGTNLPSAVASASYNTSNQQLGFGGATMSYDLNGNLASVTDGNATTTYTWNARNQLAALSGPALTATFTYDGFGRRWTKTINGARTDVLHDGLNPVQEGLLPGTPAANLLTGPGIDELLTRTDAAGLRAFLSDALGSTLALTDPTGAVTTEYTYEPFGATTFTGASSGNPYQFTGRENDATGLYYYRARYYHPGLARFISEDPIGSRGDVNLYEYVRNNPVNRIDPLGTIECNGRWQQVGWDMVANFVCVCYWLCIPCDGPVMWGGNPRTLPYTYGSAIHTGESITRGDRCLCNKPGPERDCRVPSPEGPEGPGGPGGPGVPGAGGSGPGGPTGSPSDPGESGLSVPGRGGPGPREPAGGPPSSAGRKDVC